MAYRPIKPFLTYDQQVDNLQDNKKLIIKDRGKALETLKEIRYFSLIDGYKDFFYDPMTSTYKDGASFDDIVALYDFDEELRYLMFRYIERIEQKMRSLISYNFCRRYSVNQKDYLNIACYDDQKKNHNGILKLISILDHIANVSTGHLYVNYQRSTYGNVPLWVTVNVLTLGQLSKMYSYLKGAVKADISKEYTGVNERELSQYLRVLTDFRNKCAHGERVYSSNSHTAIPDTILHKKLSIPRNGAQYLQGKTDVFSVVIAFRYLLPNEDFAQFKKQLIKLIKHFAAQSPASDSSKLLLQMGFPQNWKNMSRYRHK